VILITLNDISSNNNDDNDNFVGDNIDGAIAVPVIVIVLLKNVISDVTM